MLGHTGTGLCSLPDVRSAPIQEDVPVNLKGSTAECIVNCNMPPKPSYRRCFGLIKYALLSPTFPSSLFIRKIYKPTSH